MVLKDKVAVITGGSGAIGAASAHRLAFESFYEETATQTLWLAARIEKRLELAD